MTDEPRPESSAEVAVAETVQAASGDETAASEPAAPIRGRRTILPVGTLVGRYVLAERIGAGGMGNVYRAHDPKLDREIAIKLVATTNITAAQEYLEREAQAMAKLSHPNVATVHDIGTWNDQLFIAMELCPGGSLATWLAEPRPWRDVVKRFVEAGRGLAAAHRIGLVHRDFKPDNVLVGTDGLVKVSDFGLVRSSKGTLSTGSNPEAIEGTPAYMAPEQLTGDEVDARADQFAFAVSVWEGVCGGRPFQPEVGAPDVLEGMLRAIRGRRMMRSTASKVPARVIEILQRALAPEPKDRWPSLEALLVALERAASPSKKRWIAGGLAAMLAAAGVTYVVIEKMRPELDVDLVPKVERSLASIYEAAGDLAIARREGYLVGERKDVEVAANAYAIAHDLSRKLDLRRRLARSLLELDRCAEAFVQLERYFAEGGGPLKPDDLKYYLFTVDKSIEHIRQGDLLKMRDLCEKEEKLARSPEELDDLARAMWRSGDFDGAVNALHRAYEISQDPMYLKGMGDIRLNQGKCEDARLHYEEHIILEKRMNRVGDKWFDAVRRDLQKCKPL